MKKILVHCDFSKPAINAFRFALNIGARSKGIIHLLFVIEQPVLHDSMLMPVLSIEQDFMDGDLITMGTHGRKGIANLLAGGTTEALIKYVRWPVWTYVVN